jgi:uncharacterized protein (TIGR02597 family)
MHRFTPLFAALAVFATCCESSFAQSAVTDPYGFTTTSLLANSDTYVGVPFTRTPAFIGSISSIGVNVITVSGAPGWTNNQFVYNGGTQHDHFYVLIGTPPSATSKEGHIYSVTANGSNTLTVDTTQDSLAGIPANTQLLLIPFWTPATLFPDADVNVSFTATASPPTYKTLLRIPNYAGAGINLGYSAEYYFFNSAWQRVSPAGVGDDDVLLPDGYLVVRNNNGAPTLPFTALGAVLTKKVAAPLVSSTTQAQDNFLSMIRPIDVTLLNTGLNPTDGSFAETNSLRANNGDLLLLFDNTVAGFDKAPSVTYYFLNRAGRTGTIIGWRNTADSNLNNDYGNALIPAGSALIIRRALKPTNAVVYWTNAPTY